MSGPGERELDALMARLADGDRGAFEELFAALHPRALALARMRLEASDADDAAQQVLVRLFARAVEFTPGRPVLPWFYAIAANEIHALSRRRGRAWARERSVEVARELAAASDPEADAVREELRAAVRSAIAQLDDGSMHAIRAVLGEGPAPSEVGSAAFRKRVSRAYARLRILLGGRV